MGASEKGSETLPTQITTGNWMHRPVFVKVCIGRYTATYGLFVQAYI